MASDKTRVLDSSVLLAILNNEPFNDSTLDILPGSWMSTVNYAEVWTKLHEFGLTQDPRVQTLFDLLADIVPLSQSTARLAGDLRPLTRHLGLSLGDRCCLALAMELGVDVYTTERAWSTLDIGCEIRLLR